MDSGQWARKQPLTLSAIHYPLIEERKTGERLADEIVEGVRSWSHNAGGAGVAEVTLHADFLAKGRAPAQSHRQIGYFHSGLSRGGLAFEHAQHGVGSRSFERRE